MPLLQHDHLDTNTELGIWQITEAEAWFREQLLLHPAELRQLSVQKGRRRLEFLAARQLVHQMSGRVQRGAFIKDEYGKPHLEASDWFISISHSHGYAAAIASAAVCGIDIQFIVPKITRLAHKFLGEAEAASIRAATKIDQLHFYWGAKEALYKAYGRRQLDFKDHIFILPISLAEKTGQTTGQIVKGQTVLHFNISYERSEAGYMLVWAVRV